jgi:hypothetical protein
VRRALAVVFLVVPGVASAVEGEQALSLSARFASLTVTEVIDRRNVDLSGAGGGLMLDYQRAISDTLWLRGAVAGTLHAIEGEASFAGHATVGFTYQVDVLKYVPYVSAGLGASVVGGGVLDLAVKPYLELGLGVDVIASTTFSWGVDARFASFLSSSALILIGPRISWRWGYF